MKDKIEELIQENEHNKCRVRELEAANAELTRQLEQAQRRDAFLERLALHNLDNEAES